MTEPQEWRGEWWIAAEPETVRPGVLRRDEDDRFRLELVGGFDVGVRQPLPGGGWAVMAETREVEMIHGIAEGARYTLLFPHAIHTSSGQRTENIVKQDWSSNRVLCGIHLASPDEAVFTTAHLRLDYLLHWSNRTTMTLTIPMKDGKKAGPLEVRRLADSVAVTAQYEEMQFGLRVRSHDFNVERHPVAGTTTVQTMEWAVLDLAPPQPVPYDAFDTVYKDLQDLLTFCAYAPAAAQSRSLIYPASDAHPGHAEFPNEVRVMGPQIYRAKRSTADDTPHHNYLVRLDAIDFSELIPRWLALKEKARTGCNILFGLRYISEGYTGTRLLGIATAAENIHRALRPKNPPLTPARFKKLQEKLDDALADQPDDVRAFIRNRLHNKANYRDWLLELAAIPEAAVVDELLTDRQQWATMLRHARNDLAHADERSAASADTSAAFWLLEITYALLHLVLMAELDLDVDLQRKALDHPKISWAQARFRKILSGSSPD